MAKSVKTVRKSQKTKKPMAVRHQARSKTDPIVQVVERKVVKTVEVPKIQGKLPTPTATFYF